MSDSQGIVLKGSREFRLDQFKLKPANRLKNKSFTANQPRFVKEQHDHFYRSHNARTGKDTVISTQMGGHWHKVEVEWGTDKDGNDVIKSAKCGPALQRVEIQTGGRGLPVTKLAPIRWKTKVAPQMDGDIIDLDSGALDWVYDDHTHDVEYMHSEFLDINTSKAIKDKNRQAISNAIDTSGPQVQGMNQAQTAQKIQSSAQDAPAQES